MRISPRQTGHGGERLSPMLFPLFMASRKKTPSDRPTDRPPVEFDKSFDGETEPPTDIREQTLPPSAELPTSPDGNYFVCPACHAVNSTNCGTCMGVGIIDRRAMDAWKKKRKV